MNNTIFYYVLGTVAVAGIIGLGLTFTSKNDTGADSEQIQKNVEAKGVLRDLLARSNSKCTVKNVVANSESSGTVYISNGKMRGDFTSIMTNPAMTMETHLIIDGASMYSWNSMTPKGFKMMIASAESASGADAAQNMYNSAVNYSCEAWAPDLSIFSLPVGVEFTDMSTMMDAVKTSAGAGVKVSPQMGCASCDLIPNASAKAQCRAALSCK